MELVDVEFSLDFMAMGVCRYHILYFVGRWSHIIQRPMILPDDTVLLLFCRGERLCVDVLFYEQFLLQILMVTLDHLQLFGLVRTLYDYFWFFSFRFYLGFFFKENSYICALMKNEKWIETVCLTVPSCRLLLSFTFYSFVVYVVGVCVNGWWYV